MAWVEELCSLKADWRSVFRDRTIQEEAGDGNCELHFVSSSILTESANAPRVATTKARAKRMRPKVTQNWVPTQLLVIGWSKVGWVSDFWSFLIPPCPSKNACTN